MAGGATSTRASAAVLVVVVGHLFVGIVDELPYRKVEIVQRSCGGPGGSGGVGEDAQREEVAMEEDFVSRGKVDGDGWCMMGSVGCVELSSQ